MHSLAAIKPRFTRALLALFVTLAACGEPALDSDESAVADRGGSTATTTSLVGGLTSALLDFDPTIDPAAPPASNAMHVSDHLAAQLAGCGTVTVTDSTVTAAFGAPPGCTLTNGLTVSGSLSVLVAQSGGATTLALTLTQLVVDGATLGGTVTLSTTNGTVFNVALAMTRDAQSITGNVTVAGGPTAGVVQIVGDLRETTPPAAASTLHITDVEYATGQCYPQAGTVVIAAGLVSEAATFSAQTATTGRYTLQHGTRGASLSRTLPAYGSCPVSD